MSDTIPTPRTDEATKTTDWVSGQPMVPSDFARQLERELVLCKVDSAERAVAVDFAQLTIEKVERELTALRALTEWRDISTAPKDGNEILVVMAGRATIAWWNDQRYYEKPRPYFESIGHAGTTRDRAHQPLLWQPLPTPPKI